MLAVWEHKGENYISLTVWLAFSNDSTTKCSVIRDHHTAVSTLEAPTQLAKVELAII